ncbi:Fic family protein, partial [bacterium]|nr:Fic family protein [bacterium]
MTSEQEGRWLQKVRLDWNFHSSKIEGNSLTFGETRALLKFGITAEGKPIRDHLEIKGHNDAVEHIVDILKGKDYDITETFIRQFHEMIIPEPYELIAVTPDGKPTKRMIVPGEYKKYSNSVLTSTGETFYFAKPEDTPAEMTDLMNWYKKETEENTNHPLIIAAMFHYKFVRIHPFDDGNGRMSRILMNMILMKYGFPPVIIYVEKKEDYYSALQFADAEEAEKFIIYIGERLVESLELWLKAARGESIEDPEDIDKMVALLKKKIEWGGMDEEVKITRSKEVVIELFESSLFRLVSEFTEKLAKLNSFFKKHEISLDYEYPSKLMNIYDAVASASESIMNPPVELSYTINDKLNDIITNEIQNKSINSFTISYNLIEFINDDEMSISCDMTINFEHSYYEIQFRETEKNIKRRYHQALTEKEINEVVMSVFYSVYELIDGK